ncbi:MAG: glycosyltransferase [Nitrospiraceae bacterium]|nr:glycosyltransferase [Nitrospiraceae bacterium]
MPDILNLVLLIFQVVILLYFILINGTYTFFTLVSLKDVKRHSVMVTSQNIKNILSGIFYKPLSIIVPAYNEEATIVANVRSLLALHYPEFEVIIVNDGSKDRTLDRLINEFRLIRIDKPLRIVLAHQPITGHYLSLDYPQLTVIQKENGGKADALNAGINASNFPLFCCIDADSLLENDALLRASRLFVEDREVIATGGIVMVLNGCRVQEGTVTEVRTPKKSLECFQAVEYIRGFLSGRTSWNFLGSLLIISGAFGIFRKDMVMAINGYRKTVGEDMDIVVRLHRHCKDNRIKYKIVFVPDPVCWTQVPNDLNSLLKQRNRWHRGLIDCLWVNRVMFLNPVYGTVGVFGYPYFLFVEALGPLVEFTGYLSFIVFYLFGVISRDFALLFFVIALLWGMWINIGSILLDNLLYRRYKGIGDIIKLCLYGLIEFLGYRQLIVMERLLATFQFWKKGWGKIKRQEIPSEPGR